jgi:stage II sporulation protein D
MRPNGLAIATFLFLLNCAAAYAQDVRIGVLGIFHPQQLTLSPVAREAIVLSASGQKFFLQAGSSPAIAYIRIAATQLAVEIDGKIIKANEIHAASANDAMTGFVLGVPEKISRHYRGKLDIRVVDGALVAVVTMDLETAVASIVQAESAADSPLEELKAQAVATRSYLVAGKGRHIDFDFCDLTHCQYLREPANADSPAAFATAATRNLILTFDEKPIAGMFTRSCSGQTRTPAEIGIPDNGYPYFSVRCDVCYKNPVRWTRQVSPQDADILFAQREVGRLAVNRRLGSSAVPSNNFTARKVDGEVLLHGTGEGHGVGLCQRGARAMATDGAGFRKIILHYFPNTKIEPIAEPPSMN